VPRDRAWLPAHLAVRAWDLERRGTFWDEGKRTREAHGSSIVRHTGPVWEIAGSIELGGEPPVRFQNDYRIAAPREDARVLPWKSDNPTIGPLSGVFFVEGDTILSSFQSREGEFVGSEHMTCLAPNCYRARGLFLRSGAIVSAWSMDLVRQA
jgi:hypothetical protein